MAAITNKSRSLFFALFFLLSHALRTTSAHQRHTESCAPFTCGQLQDISYPFRRRDDPPECGETPFQLNCQDNESTISIGSVDYLLTQIQYQSYDFYVWMSHEISLRLVDPNLVDGGRCGLPSQSLSPSTLTSLGEWLNLGLWASFMNCSKAIEDEGMNWPNSCPSHYDSTNVYIVIAEDGYKLQYLHPSCEFMSMIPLAHYNQSLSLNSTADALSILQHGFYLTRSLRIGKVKLLGKCLRGSFASMFYDETDHKFTFKSDSLTLGAILIGFCLQESFNHTVSFNSIITAGVFSYIVFIFVVLLILARLIVAPIIIWFWLAYKLWSIKKQEAIDTVEKFLRHQETLMPTRYGYTDIIAITRHFKEKLGQGGFGLVFKGELVGGILVAVKMMGSSKCNGEEFISEVSTIGMIHHVNVVRLVGYCSEGSKRALVYEYMPNGSLDKYIFSNKNTTILHSIPPQKLFDIAIGIARGIDYLHRGCDMQILHFDIKPHNILLDHNFTPKISDFGLAKLYPKDNSLVSISAARGTIGYIAPELISRSFGVISQKSDVYSYGMLLLEMAGRRRNVNPLVGNSSQVYYPSWIYDKLNQEQDITLDISFEINELEKKLAIVGLWCIQMKSFDRPTMTKVIEMLHSDVEMIPMPPKPFLSSTNSILENKTCLVSSSIEVSVVLE